MIRKSALLPALAAILVLSSEAVPQVAPKIAFLGSCSLSSGAVIPNCRLAYRMFGQLNAARDNAVLIPTWLLGRSDEWVPLLGPDAILDTTKFHVVVVDAFADGLSSSPSNTSPSARGVFAGLTIGDMVVAQHRLVHEHLGIERLRAVLGFSMGGMQAFEWAVRYPTELDLAIPISGSPRVGNFDRLLWTKYLDEVGLVWRAWSAGRRRGSGWRASMTLMLRTPSAVNRESWDSVEASIRSRGRAPGENLGPGGLRGTTTAIRHYDASQSTGWRYLPSCLEGPIPPADHPLTPGPHRHHRAQSRVRPDGLLRHLVGDQPLWPHGTLV